MRMNHRPTGSGEPLDPQLAKILEELRSTPERSSERVASGKARFLAEMKAEGLDAFSPSRSTPASGSFFRRFFSRRHTNKEETDMFTGSRRFVFSGLSLLVLIGALLFGGAGITATAAQSALPGDALYPVKTTLEHTRLTLARDAGYRAQMKMEFAERRLNEITALIEAGRYGMIGAASQEFRAEIEGALAELVTITAGDPERAEALTAQITEALSSYAQVLSGLAARVPEAIKPELDQALETTRMVEGARHSADVAEFIGVVEAMGAEIWIISGQEVVVNRTTEVKGAIQVGNTVKVHLYLDTAGGLVVREIELVSGDGYTNDNANESGIDDDDVGDDDSSNANGNEDHDDDADDDRSNNNDNMNGDDDDDDDEDDSGNDNSNMDGDDDDDDNNMNGDDNDDDEDDSGDDNSNMNGDDGDDDDDDDDYNDDHSGDDGDHDDDDDD